MIVLLEGTWRGGERSGSSTPLNVPYPGRLQASVDWTRPGSDVDLYLAVGPCTSYPSGPDAKVAPACSIVASATGSAKPEVLVAEVEAQRYTLIDYVASAAILESGSYRITLEPSQEDGNE